MNSGREGATHSHVQLREVFQRGFTGRDNQFSQAVGNLVIQCMAVGSDNVATRILNREQYGVDAIHGCARHQTYIVLGHPGKPRMAGALLRGRELRGAHRVQPCQQGLANCLEFPSIFLGYGLCRW